jgi:tetratricopeptide (TPR) repeat protein
MEAHSSRSTLPVGPSHTSATANRDGNTLKSKLFTGLLVQLEHHPSQLPVQSPIFAYKNYEESKTEDEKALEAINYCSDAQMLTRQKEYTEAIKLYDKAVALTSDTETLREIHVKALFSRGQAKKVTGDITEALSDYTDAINRADDISTIQLHLIYTARANLLNREERSDEAIKDYEKVCILLLVLTNIRC